MYKQAITTGNTEMISYYVFDLQKNNKFILGYRKQVFYSCNTILRFGILASVGCVISQAIARRR